nr:MAG TPA: hypothetical protein [Caudoviricetes sp.]
MLCINLEWRPLHKSYNQQIRSMGADHSSGFAAAIALIGIASIIAAARAAAMILFLIFGSSFLWRIAFS